MSDLDVEVKCLLDALDKHKTACLDLEKKLCSIGLTTRLANVNSIDETLFSR
jgi:hypothetical protein